MISLITAILLSPITLTHALNATHITDLALPEDLHTLTHGCPYHTLQKKRRLCAWAKKSHKDLSKNLCGPEKAFSILFTNHVELIKAALREFPFLAKASTYDQQKLIPHLQHLHPWHKLLTLVSVIILAVEATALNHSTLLPPEAQITLRDAYKKLRLGSLNFWSKNRQSTLLLINSVQRHTNLNIKIWLKDTLQCTPMSRLIALQHDTLLIPIPRNLLPYIGNVYSIANTMLNNHILGYINDIYTVAKMPLPKGHGSLQQCIHHLFKTIPSAIKSPHLWMQSASPITIALIHICKNTAPQEPALVEHPHNTSIPWPIPRKSLSIPIVSQASPIISSTLLLALRRHNLQFAHPLNPTVQMQLSDCSLTPKLCLYDFWDAPMTMPFFVHKPYKQLLILLPHEHVILANAHYMDSLAIIYSTAFMFSYLRHFLENKFISTRQFCQMWHNCLVQTHPFAYSARVTHRNPFEHCLLTA